jgi:glycosyltransferase involved in cell wall biosynthesis
MLSDLAPPAVGCRYDLAVSDLVATRPAICLNMIVRNEAHIIRETLNSVVPYISEWVIVDTGSNDGTQDLIRNHLAALGVPGELHERPWRDFGYNRSEALEIAQGHGDYIWVIDADDIVVGAPDFSQLSADVYTLRRRYGTTIYWRPELYRDGVHARWVGVTHEYATWDDHYVAARLEGEYHIADRQLSVRNLSGEKFARDRDLLLPEVERNPEDSRSVFYLAQSYFDLGDNVNARKWYERRVEMGGWDHETVYFSMLRLAESMANLGEPWPNVQDAYLRAWEFRPTRAESLYSIAFHYRAMQRYRLGYLFAQRAAQIPLPESDNLFVMADIYSWRTIDEQAVCAYWLGKHDEAFTLSRRLLAHPDLPVDVRPRIAVNRDYSAPAMIEAALSYPDTLVRNLITGSRNADVTVSLVAGPNHTATEQTLNSFLHCCTDLARIGRFVVFESGISTQDREMLHDRYPFLEFIESTNDLRTHIQGRFWLHLSQNWQFFAPEKFITRLTAVLAAEPEVFQVGINFTDATTLIGNCAAEDVVHRTPDAGRYVLTAAIANGPAMIDTTRPDETDTGPHTATLDEVLCIAAV